MVWIAPGWSHDAGIVLFGPRRRVSFDFYSTYWTPPSTAKFNHWDVDDMSKGRKHTLAVHVVGCRVTYWAWCLYQTAFDQKKPTCAPSAKQCIFLFAVQAFYLQSTALFKSLPVMATFLLEQRQRLQGPVNTLLSHESSAGSPGGRPSASDFHAIFRESLWKLHSYSCVCQEYVLMRGTFGYLNHLPDWKSMTAWHLPEHGTNVCPSCQRHLRNRISAWREWQFQWCVASSGSSPACKDWHAGGRKASADQLYLTVEAFYCSGGWEYWKTPCQFQVCMLWVDRVLHLRRGQWEALLSVQTRVDTNNSVFLRFLEFGSGRTSAFPNNSTVEGAFSMIGREMVESLRALTGFSLEWTLQWMQSRLRGIGRLRLCLTIRSLQNLKSKLSNKYKISYFGLVGDISKLRRPAHYNWQQRDSSDIYIYLSILIYQDHWSFHHFNYVVVIDALWEVDSSMSGVGGQEMSFYILFKFSFYVWGFYDKYFKVCCNLRSINRERPTDWKSLNEKRSSLPAYFDNNTYMTMSICIKHLQVQLNIVKFTQPIWQE